MEDSGLGDISDATSISTIIAMRNLQRGRYMTAAGLALWLWDALITLDTEIIYVWNRKFSMIKTIYLLVSPLSTVCRS